MIYVGVAAAAAVGSALGAALGALIGIWFGAKIVIAATREFRK